MQPKLLKYILDIESIIQEIEKIKQLTQNNFNSFQSEIYFQRAVERDLEIIGFSPLLPYFNLNPTPTLQPKLMYLR
jgi:hypothetical protein